MVYSCAWHNFHVIHSKHCRVMGPCTLTDIGGTWELVTQTASTVFDGLQSNFTQVIPMMCSCARHNLHMTNFKPGRVMGLCTLTIFMHKHGLCMRACDTHWLCSFWWMPILTSHMSSLWFEVVGHIILIWFTSFVAELCALVLWSHWCIDLGGTWELLTHTNSKVFDEF